MMLGKKTEKLESLVGANCTFEGTVETKGTIRIDGTIKGNVKADWIILGESANVNGDFSAKGIIVGGAITGNILARESVEIRQKGKVFGDIRTTKLTIVEGAIFEGRSSMQKQDAIVVDLPSKEKGTSKSRE